jgi:polar amino acid transport system substrate-binding protein
MNSVNDMIPGRDRVVFPFRRFFPLWIIAVLPLFNPSAYAAGDPPQPTPMNAVEAPADPECCLTIYTEDFPPLNYELRGKPAGFVVEIVREIMRRTDCRDAIRVTRWNEAYRMIRENTATAVFSMARIAGRESEFKWVGPISKNDVGFYVRKDSDIRASVLDDLKEVKRIGTVTDYASEEMLKTAGFTNLVSDPDPKSCARKLFNRWIDVWVMPDLAMPYVAANAGIDPRDFREIFRVSEPDNYIAFSRDVPDSLITRWQSALDAMRSDGTFQNLAQKWLPDESNSVPAETAKPATPSSFVAIPDRDAILQAGELTRNERMWLAAHPVIRIAPDPAGQPMEGLDKKGHYEGIAADFVRLVEKKLGIRFEIVAMPD